LSALGFQAFQDTVTDNADIMTSAYRTLFRLENFLRQFIESQMRAKYGSDWWDKHVSAAVKAKVDEMRQHEHSMSWQVSEVNSNTEYLLFDHLQKIIMINWIDVFRPLFGEQAKIDLRLKELESIRNSIAHARRLSLDGMNRLEQYSQDLLNMMNVGTT
jgi:hypothetical protein